MRNSNLQTVRQVAEQLGVAVVTIRTWMSQRRIKYVKLGRCVRIPESEVQRIIDAGTVPSRERRS